MSGRIPKITLDKKNIAVVAENLGYYLADTMVLYVKTLNFHWNMVGEQFFMYHKLLQEQYEELADAADMLAERIRQLGYSAPGSLADFLKLTRLKEAKTTLSQDKMIQELVVDHEAMVASGHDLIDFCDEAYDQGSSDMVIDRIRVHDKNAWLLRSHFTKSR